MSTPNHIIGGITITGFFCSILDINIFSQLHYLIIVIVGSLLPDIDTPKSIIGKVFYPISKQIFRKYGHRTITHSILFVACIFTISRVLELYFLSTKTLSLIFTTGITVHILLDIVTVAGVPLFYPFFKNPCVMPGSRSARILTGKLSHEFPAFLILITIGIICYPIYTQGFWTNLNNQIGTYRQLHNQYYREKNKVLKCNYIIHQDWQRLEGTAFVIEVDPSIVLLDIETQKFLKLNEKDGGHFESITTNLQKETREKTLKINHDTTLENVYYINIIASEPLTFIANNKRTESSHFEQKFINKLDIIFPPEQTNQQEILNKKQELNFLLFQQKRQQEKNAKIQIEIDSLRQQYSTANFSRKNKIKSQIQSLEANITKKDFHFQIEKKQLEIEIIQNQPKPKRYCNIFIQTLKLPSS